MLFTVEINKDEIFPVIHLKDIEEKTLVEIFAFGALLNRFKISDSINIIDGFSSPADAKENITNGFKSAKLSPFVCRINKGKYAFKAQQFKIEKFYLGNEAIHGLLFNEVFSVVDFRANDYAAFVSLQYHYYKNDPGFPFEYLCIINYTLEKNNELTIETSVSNLSDAEIPICDGWHPYFTLGAKINELSLEMNADKMLEFDENLLPTGNILSYQKFQQQEVFGTTILDNCFLLNEIDKPACILKNRKNGLQLIIKPDKSYPYLQIYTPEHRNSIAIENLSAAPDAFNNNIGLKFLQPGKTISFKTKYTATINV